MGQHDTSVTFSVDVSVNNASILGRKGDSLLRGSAPRKRGPSIMTPTRNHVAMRKVRGDGTQLKAAEGWSAAGKLPVRRAWRVASARLNTMFEEAFMSRHYWFVWPSAVVTP